MSAVIQYILYLAVLIVLAIPLGAYIKKVMDGEKTFLSRILTPCENAVYKVMRVDKDEQMTWKKYAVSVLIFSGIGLVFLFLLQLLQGVLPGNPQGLSGVKWDLSFNTASSFVTNTNWQAYSGESTLSYLTQAIGLTVQNFVSAATGIAVLFALIRGFIKVKTDGLGSFWVDMTRIIIHILIPLNLVIALCLVGGGVIQSLKGADKETRFGIATSSTWAAFTTAASNGSVNSMHDSYTPLGGMVTMLLMQLGEVIFGGVGCGLYGMLAFAILTVFIAGLMVGRTPEFLGKKIEPYEMKWSVLVCLATPIAILIGSGLAAVVPSVADSLNNGGAHGFSEMLYAYSSAGGNNGSAFAGFNTNTVFLNISLGLVMLFVRFLPIIGTLAIAGSLAGKKKIATSAGTLSTTNAMFVFLLIFIVILIGALSFFPALALKGVKYREVPAGKLLSRNLLIYGLGGLAAPFIFIKLIDLLLVLFGLA